MRFRKRLLLLTPVAAIALYLCAALIGTLILRNSGFEQPDSGVTIYVETNGIHTGIVLPVAAAGVDLSLLFRPTDLPNANNAGNWLAIGWGDRDFYLNTPTWADLRLRTVVIALVGSGSSLIHVDHLDRPYPDADRRAVRITPAQYRSLVRAIAATLKRGTDGHPRTIAGYSDLDIFYEAHGRYNLLRTCNVWTGDTLANAAITAPLWSPFSAGVMWWY